MIRRQARACRAAGLASVLLGAAIAASAGAADAPQYTEQQLSARFYYDLGPAELDVSGYSEAHQDAYAVFARVCSQCHTLARPLNSPLIQRGDWDRFVRRMHLRARGSGKSDVTRQEAKSIVDFLAFDSKERKVKDRVAFKARQDELKAFFAKVRKARKQMQAERNRGKAQPAPAYTGVK